MIQDLDDRMKGYEKVVQLPINIPLILRIDGRAFHTFTRGMERPFDEKFIDMMNTIGTSLCEDIQNCRMAYLQSDEISFLIYNRIESALWFDNSVQKMCSVAASRAASVGTNWLHENMPHKISTISFDARVNVYPEKDVANYFIWRQSDWGRNSIQMVTHSHYSQKQMQNKNTADMHEMLFQKDDNWDAYPTHLKRGRCIVKQKTNEAIANEFFSGLVERRKWIVDNEIPIFTKDRNYIFDKMEDDFVREDCL